MGVLDALFGGSETATASNTSSSDGSSEQKYAILLTAGPDQTATAGNAFNYALELDDAGYEVGVYLDGKATRLPGAYAEEPDRPFGYDWERIRERNLLIGACGYCANAFEAAQACSSTGVDLLSGADEHAPEVADLADDGYELLPMG